MTEQEETQNKTSERIIYNATIYTKDHRVQKSRYFYDHSDHSISFISTALPQSHH